MAAVNGALAAASGALGVRLDPYLGFNFLVEIESLVVGGFTEVGGLSVETEVTPFREGGQNAYVHMLAGPTKYPNLVLKHGVTDVESLWLWQQEVATGRITRRNGTIYLLDRQRLPAMWWNFQDAYPVKWQGPALRADSGTVAVETVELVHRGIEKPMASSLMSGARLAASLVSQVT